MKRKYFLYSVGLFLIVSAVSFILSEVSKNQVPNFYWKTIEEIKNDTILINEIGGYESYEFTYNEYEEKSGKINFDIIIIGEKKNIVCKGNAEKNSSDWIVLEKDCRIVPK